MSRRLRALAAALALALPTCHPPVVGAAGAAEATDASVVIPRVDLDAAELLAQGAIWPHPGAPPLELPAAQRIVGGALTLRDGEALLVQVPGRLLGKGNVVVDLAPGSAPATLRVFALWVLFDDLPATRGRTGEFQGRLGTLLRTRPVPERAAGAAPADAIENDPNGVGLLVTVEAPRGAEIAVEHLRFDELLPAAPARQMVGGETRPCVPVAAGSTRRFVLPPAPAGATVELAFALHDRMAPPRAPLRATATLPGSTEKSIARTFAAGPVGKAGDERAASEPRRFEPIVFHLPEGTRGPAVVEVAVESAREGSGPTAALVAVPRLVPRRTGPKPWSVLLLSIDTLRNDRLDDPRGLTPGLARLARECVRFTRCYSPANFTVPAHASMMTGLQPIVHGANRFGDRVSIRAWPNLAGQLSAAGALTAAFTGGGFVDPAFGFDENFDCYGALDPCISPRDPRYEGGPRHGSPEWNRALRAGMSVRTVADWVDAHAAARFFLFVHTYFAHDYWPTPARARRFGAADDARWPRPLDLKSGEIAAVAPGSPQLEWYRALYDAAVNETDAALTPLLARLLQPDLLDSTVIVATADHGEAFREHDTIFHATGLHDEVLHVPLLIHVPGIAAATVDAPVSLIDLAPTLLELAGAEPLPETQGVSLVPLLHGREAPERLLLSQDCPPATEGPAGQRIEIDHSALIGPRFKLLRRITGTGPVEELYDLLEDPGETRDLAHEPADAAALAAAHGALDRVLSKMHEAAERAKARRLAAPISDSLNDDLRKLGY